MKLKKQKYLILLVVTLLNTASVFAGPTPPSPGGGGGSGGSGGPGGPPVLPGLPIDSEIIFLFVAALALGIYKIVELNKKRQFEK